MPGEGEKEIIKDFLEPHFGIGFSPAPITPEEDRLIGQTLEFVSGKFSDARYVLGLAIDFALLAQQLSLHDPGAKEARLGLTKEDIFARYTLITARAGRAANTLTLQYGRQRIGIRKIEESIIDLFIDLTRPGYPSAYVYNTGQWHKFQDTLLVPCFRLSESGRFRLCNALIDYGLTNLTQGTSLGRESPRVRLFEEIVRHYPRAHAGENSGSVFQGIACGFMTADRPHLTFIVDKVRTGSARQNRIGDIDGYYGLDLEVSVEVKDHPLTGTNINKEVGEFLMKASANRVMGIVFALSADEEAAAVMAREGARRITQEMLLAVVALWDWRKQDAAVQGVLHYLAHVEQNPDAVRRLLGFIRERDPGHDSLAYYSES
jgi:hypothetical protein